MNILLTNDDGLESPGLQLLAKALRGEGHRVIVIAPDRDRSGVSHSISFLGGPLVLNPRGDDTWACSGLPVDCVVIAFLGGTPVKPDLVLSGINRGANLGTDLLYSGTAAAARQGSLFGLPSVALSLVEVPGGDYHWEGAVRFSLSRLDEILGRWKAGTFLNLNIPNSPQGPGGMVAAFPSYRRYNDSMEMMDAPNGNRYCFFHAGEVETIPPEEGCDQDIISQNLAALSSVWVHPVSADLRDPAARIWT
ncbi:MAG: 5'/3'-nucleotidase SurE [Treponema sp.]|jgi:5'-nucleotidase|nr:5'/3'-nucleotidase SurE [Treponema sp.]